MKKDTDFFKDFYSENGSVDVAPIDLAKSQVGGFYGAVDCTRPLRKGQNTNVASVLEFHMKKASEAEEAKKKKKNSKLEDF